MTPKVSVILPTFNRLHYLRAAVDSVFEQTMSDWELIIADDGSDGETTGYLNQLANDPRVTLLRLHHCGNPAAVRNAGLQIARGQYIAFLDSDDLWVPAKLAVQLAAHAACPSRRWSYTALTRIDAAGEPLRTSPTDPWVPHQGAIFEQLLTISAIIATPSVMAERSLIEGVGGFDERQPYFEDYDLWWRLGMFSEVISVNEPLVLVRTHAQHYSADRISVYEARFRLLDKMADHAGTARLRRVLRVERAKNAASLALVSAIAGRRAAALRMLWRSRRCAPHYPGWWLRRARATLARALAPSWLIEMRVK